MIDAANVRRCASSASVRTISSSFFGDADRCVWGVGVARADSEVTCVARCFSVWIDVAPNKDSTLNQESRTKILIKYLIER